MLRESNDCFVLDTAAATRPVSNDASVAGSPYMSSPPPVTFVGELLINGRRMPAPVAELHPRQARTLQCIAELVCRNGGFRVFGAGPLVRASIKFSALGDVYSARTQVLKLRNQLIGLVNTMNPKLASGGGGCKDIDAQVRDSSATGAYLQIEVIIELPDRSDAPAVGTLIAKLAPLIEQLTHGTRSGVSI
ncbi:MAG: hypothetical protein RR326_08590, partial [Stenotrophomonas sp.]